LNIKSWNYVCALLAAVFILSSGVSMVFAAPDSPPTLKLVKSVITDDGGTAVPDDWNLFAFDEDEEIIFNQGGSGNFETVPENTEFTLSESGPEGYMPGVWSCTDGKFTNPDKIQLELGDRVTCTITNNDIAPTLQLVKIVETPFGGTAVPNDWILSAIASASGPDSARNQNTPGGLGEPQEVFAFTIYHLSESSDNLAYTPKNDGKWDCTVTFPNGRTINFPPVFGISLSVGDNAICTVTNVEDPPSVSIQVPLKIHGKLTVSSEVKGFEDKVPVGFKVYKMDDNVKSMVYEGFVSASPYNFSIPAKILDAGSSYEITATASDDNGKSATKSVMVNIPAKGNKG
jgi:hypothetical protein